MKLFRVILVVVCLSLVADSLQAQSVIVTSKVRQKYIGSNGGDFYDKPAWQTDAMFFSKSGWFGGGWFSTAFHKPREFDTEFDLIWGKAGKAWKKLDYSVDGEYFFVKDKDVVNLNMELTHDFPLENVRSGKITPFLRMELYSPAKHGGPRKGVFGIVGARSQAELSSRLIASLEAGIRKDSGSFGFNSALLGQGRGAIGLKLNGSTTLVPAVKWYQPLSHVRDGRKKQIIMEIGFVRIVR